MESGEYGVDGHDCLIRHPFGFIQRLIGSADIYARNNLTQAGLGRRVGTPLFHGNTSVSNCAVNQFVFPVALLSLIEGTIELKIEKAQLKCL